MIQKERKKEPRRIISFSQARRLPGFKIKPRARLKFVIDIVWSRACDNISHAAAICLSTSIVF